MSDVTRICLWSGPRNISTALMYAFAQRADTTVYDEPLYAHYLTAYPAAVDYHPAAAAVLDTMEHDGAIVVRDVILGPQPTPVAFFKQMTHHLVALDWSFMAETVNILLTRDPREMLPSYARNVTQPTLRDVGYAKQVALLTHLRRLGQEPIVLDARLVLENPPSVLNQLCARIGIPFDPRMLSWPAGPRPEDGVWAAYWYDAVHRSTGFAPYRPKTTPFPDHLRPLLDECLPYYHQLRALALSAEESAA